MLGSLVLAVAVSAALAAPASAGSPDQWTGDGTGTTTVVPDGSSADPRFSYDADGSFSGDWEFRATASATRSLPVTYDYSGHPSWFQLRVFAVELHPARRCADRVADLADDGPVDCCDAPRRISLSGATTFDVQAGDVYGFHMTGSH